MAANCSSNKECNQWVSLYLSNRYLSTITFVKLLVIVLSCKMLFSKIVWNTLPRSSRASYLLLKYLSYKHTKAVHERPEHKSNKYTPQRNTYHGFYHLLIITFSFYQSRSVFISHIELLVNDTKCDNPQILWLMVVRLWQFMLLSMCWWMFQVK